MKTSFNNRLKYLVNITILVFHFCSCAEDQIEIKTGIVTESSSHSLTIIGDIVDIGPGIDQYGHMLSHDKGFTQGVRTTSFWYVNVGSFTSSFEELEPNTMYYVRAYASHGTKYSYGSVISYATSPMTIPAVTTTSVTSVTFNSAHIICDITDYGGATIIARGVCWSTNQNPTISDSKTDEGGGNSSFTSIITELTPNTTYFVRAYATNSKGLSYGDQLTFTTYAATITDDRDGNTYNGIRIGNQIWMVENLKYLPSVGPSDKGSYDTPFYYVYDYSGVSVSEAKATSHYTTYGVLYNWTAAMSGQASSSNNPSGVQGVCPSGWHLPSDAEWTELTEYLGDTAVAGGKLKEMGNEHWDIPNTGATNETRFTALPGGSHWCWPSGCHFSGIRESGYWLSSTATTELWIRSLNYNDREVNRTWGDKFSGYSVRCVKD